MEMKKPPRPRNRKCPECGGLFKRKDETCVIVGTATKTGTQRWHTRCWQRTENRIFRR